MTESDIKARSRRFQRVTWWLEVPICLVVGLGILVFHWWPREVVLVWGFPYLVFVLQGTIWIEDTNKREERKRLKRLGREAARTVGAGR